MAQNCRTNVLAFDGIDTETDAGMSGELGLHERGAVDTLAGWPAQIPGSVRFGGVSGWPRLQLSEIWDFRELLWFLALRDIQLRYKQTVLGVSWAIIQPFFTMVVFSIFFGRLANVPSNGLPYPVFVFCALLPWQLFASSLGNAAGSVVSNQALITKVYFPRVIIPMASILYALVDFAIALIILILMMVYYKITPGPEAVLLPLFGLFTSTAALAVGLWLSALNVQYRDIRHVLPFITQLWLFITPVVYPTSIVPDQWRWLYALNPLTGVVEGFRWALLGAPAPGPWIYVSVMGTIVLLISGLYYFRRVENTFADVV